MSRSPLPSRAPLLLLVGAALLAAVGFRSLYLAQHASEQARQARLQMIHADLRADANRLLRAPRARPLAHWRLEPAGRPPEVPDLRADSGSVIGLVPSRETAHVRDLELAERAQEAGDEVQALALYREAAGALPLLLDGQAPPRRVRDEALRQLAWAGLQQGQAGALVAFLQDVEDGARLAPDGEIGPAQQVLQLHRQVQEAEASGASWVAPETAAARTRLAEAASHARRGLSLRAFMPADGARLLDPHWALRHGVDLWVFPVSALFEGDFGAPVASVRVLSADEAERVRLAPTDVRLDPPFERVVLQVVPEPPDRSAQIGALALVLGLLVYLAGGFLLLRGWRRSRHAARQQADFVASVSHELKTPIASVRAMAELLADSAGEDPERARVYAERIDREMQRLGGTVRNVLDAAQIERGTLPVHPAPGAVDRWLEALAGDLEPELALRGVAFQRTVEPTSRTWLFDPAALEGVVRNLVDNAVKFSPGEKEVELVGIQAADGYTIEVRDRGVGIDPGEEARLFGRFYRGGAAQAGAASGVGLGLHIARQVADRHGARLTARPRARGGAVFSVELRRMA